MIPKIVCRDCGAEILQSDRFCSSCGSKVEWGLSPAAASRDEPAPAGTCRLCGQSNPPGSSSCQSCGASLTPRISRQPQPTPLRSSLPLLHSWKLTAATALLLIVTVIVLKGRHDDKPAAGAPGASAEISVLRNAVERNPKDAASLLRLANLYYDLKSYPLAVAAYDRYLSIDSTNADARVDMAISYFNMSFSDSTRGEEYLRIAQDEMITAIRYSPKHQLAHFNLGIISFHTGENEQAIEWFKKCIAIDPGSETAKRAQQFLDQHQKSNRSSL